MNEIEISKVRVSIIRKMYETKFTINDIAKIMRLAIPTVQRYVKPLLTSDKQSLDKVEQ